MAKARLILYKIVHDLKVVAIDLDYCYDEEFYFTKLAIADRLTGNTGVKIFN